jgi:Holliday junction resolvase RusA-like endonuclease
MILHFKILSTPKAKQSMRMGKNKYTGAKISYIDQEVVLHAASIKHEFTQQLKEQAPGYIPTNGPVTIKALFVFPLPDSAPKKIKEAMAAGKTVYKIKRPDLQDNLMKQICDCLNGVVYLDDARICHVKDAKKIYGDTPRLELLISTNEIEYYF